MTNKHLSIEKEYLSNIKKIDERLKDLREIKTSLEEHEKNIHDTFVTIKNELDITQSEYIKYGAVDDLKEINSMLDILVSDYQQAKADVGKQLDKVEDEEKSTFRIKDQIEESYKQEIEKLHKVGE